MYRSRRRTSRGLIAVLALIIVISLICVLRETGRTTVSQDLPALPTLSVLQTALPPATTRPAPIVQTVAPIQTLVPDSSAPLPPAAPTSRPSGAATWSQLLMSGSADGSPASGIVPIVTGNGPLADGRARMAAGEVIDARAVLNDALQSGRLNVADATATKSLIAGINQTVVFSTRAFLNDPYGGTYAVRSGESLARIAAAHGTTWDLLSRINHLDPRRLRYGSTIKIVRGPFFAVVHKAEFTMDMYLGGLPGDKGSMYVTSFPVGLGKDDSTPTGLWAIAPHAKLKHPTYYPPEGGQPIQADDPTNPLGGYWIALTGVSGQAIGRTSYGIHGTIDPNSIGHQASMGCIRLRNADIALVFELLVEGKSKVLVE
jgi:LysM repeat protein